MELVTLASPGERETGAALMAHYRQWHREQFPGGTAGPLNDEDLQAAYLGGFHLALSLVVYLAPPPAPPGPRWPDRAAAAFTPLGRPRPCRTVGQQRLQLCHSCSESVPLAGQLGYRPLVCSLRFAIGPVDVARAVAEFVVCPV